MAEKTETAAPAKRGRKAGVPLTPLALLDYKKPIAVIMDRTETRANFATFTADTIAEATALAVAAADKIVLTTGRQVVIWGAQTLVKGKPTVATIDMPLAFFAE